MLNGENIRLRRIEKADLWHLWEWHEEDELYLFNSIKSFISFDELSNNFFDYFSWKSDFIIYDKNINILGVCSYQNINWKNRSCSISFKMQETYCDLLFSVEVVQILVSMIFNELNLIKIDSYVPQVSFFEIKTFNKAGFEQEGILREHIFKNNKYLDMYIFSLLRGEEVTPMD